MPRIDPLSLLKCLSVLLGPNGGIKSKEEVIRLANLMTKFSKKLVSKCIYIQILKSTEPGLLDQFMAAGGWNLIHMWLTDGILAKNWALIQELLELLLLCPVDTNRLKSNHCPKLIKGLSKEGSHHGVRTLASRLVEQWLRMVKGEATPSTESVQGATVSNSVNTPNAIHSNANITPVPSQNINSENAATIHTNDSPIVQNSSHPLQNQHEPTKNISFSKVSLTNNSCKEPQGIISSSVYKIIIRDGKQVLTQVKTDAANINNIIGVNNVDSEVSDEVGKVVFTEEESSKITTKSETNVQRTSSVDKNKIDHVSKETSNDKKDNNLINETDSVKSKDYKNEKDVSGDVSKSTSDKENRDKRDDKKSGSSDKKSSSNLQSSSKSSGKYSSSSSKHSSSSSKHSSSSHRSNSKSSSSSSSSSSASKDKSSRDKERDKYHSSSSSKSSSSKLKTDREREKEKQKKEQAEKDKATLEKIQSQSLSSRVGKIPKKKYEEEKSEDSSKKPQTDHKDSKENKDKKPVTITEKKKISMSIESRKNSQDSTRPKTVKTYNSKFRSTGLEEEVKPPPPRGSKKPTSVPDKKITVPPKLPLKRPSPIKESGPLDKKAKLALESPPADEKKGGIKIIPAKPKLMLLEDNDMFMDALMVASTKSKEPRKRKRRTSLTKDGPTEAKKPETGQENHRDAASPPVSPTSPPQNTNKDAEDKSLVKPTFKFYQDTLETDDDKEDKSKAKSEEELAKEVEVDAEDDKKPRKETKVDDNEDRDGSRTPTPENEFEDEKSSESPEDPAAAVSEALSKEDPAIIDSRTMGVLKSVLVHQKRKGPKKSLKWKTDLESIRYFELDETERVNVTKTSFTDMKQMEKMNERDAFQMARKLNGEDVMEEKTLWKPLIPIDTPPALVEPGKDSREKDIQYAREKGILQALYFHRGMIPDSASEPDEERHHIFIEPKIIPLDDLTGNKESEKDYSNLPWPESKPLPASLATAMPSSFFQTFRPTQQPMIPPMGVQPQMNPMPQQMMNTVIPEINPLPPVSGGGGWRTGDGKIVVPDPSITPMPSMNATYPQGMDVAPMVAQNMMGPPMYNQDGYSMGPDEMSYNYQGPPGPGMFGPGGPPSGGPPPFQGPRGPPMHGNRGRGWFRGGPPPRGMPWRGGWRGNGKQPPVCRQFKNGHCRIGDKCHFLHPGQNFPPF